MFVLQQLHGGSASFHQVQSCEGSVAMPWHGEVRRELANSTLIVHALDIVWNGSVEVRVVGFGGAIGNRLREGDQVLDAAAVAHQTRCRSLRSRLIMTFFNVDGAFAPGHNGALLSATAITGVIWWLQLRAEASTLPTFSIPN